MSVLAIVLIAFGVLVVLLFIGGLVARRRHDRQLAPDYLRHIAEADNALEQARAADRGWDREDMEAVARQALESAHPGVTFERLHLVLVDDQPGVNEDRAHFEAWDGDRAVRVVLTRSEAGWAAEAGVDLRGRARPRLRARRTSWSAAWRPIPSCWRGSPGAGRARAIPRGRWASTWPTCCARSTSGARPGARRSDLRFLALVHDSLKSEVDNWRRRMGENHHAMRARRFAERYTDDERLLGRSRAPRPPVPPLEARFGAPASPRTPPMAEMLDRIPDRDLFVRFVELDGSTEGKNPEPLELAAGAASDLAVAAGAAGRLGGDRQAVLGQAELAEGGDLDHEVETVEHGARDSL